MSPSQVPIATHNDPPTSSPLPHSSHLLEPLPASHPPPLPSFSDHSCLDTQRLFLKSESVQSFQLFNLLPLKKIWEQRPFWLKIHPPNCHGDKHMIERIVNVLTSVPFIVIGIQAPRKRVATKLFADSVVGVGIASGIYHSSHGDARKFFRWGDYAMIATSTLLLSRALKTNKNDATALYMASAAMVPVQPLLVSALHFGLMEVAFAQRAQAEPQLRRAYAVHAASTLIGGALFVAEDVFPETPYLHAAWHIAAAIGTATCLKLLER